MSARSVILCIFLGLLSGSTLLLAQSADYYVATNGNDSWSGTLAAPNSNKTDGPFRTIQHAQTAVRSILSNPQGRTEPIVVMIRQGTYWQSTPLLFSKSDSGTSQLQVNWENYPGENPVISGGVQVKSWSNIGGNQWQATLSSSTNSFDQLFYNGQRRLRPRLGSDSNNVGTYYRVLSTVYLNGSPPPSPPPDPNCSVYVSGKGWECFDRFKYSSSDPISDSWKNLAPPSGNHCGQSAGNPNLVGDIQLLIFETWTAAKLRISCVDPNDQMIYLTGGTSSQYPETSHGFLPGHRYLIENIQDDLQQPGQWFLNRSKTPWVLTYLSNTGENPNSDTIVVPQASQVLVASELQYVTFQGLSLEHDNFVVPSTGYQSNHGDFNITAAVSCQNCQHVTFDSDIVTQTSGTGMEFISCNTKVSPTWCVTNVSTDQNAHNTVQNSGIFDIGGAGIRVGSPADWHDTDSSVPQFLTVQNTAIEGISRSFPSTYGIAQGSGHDILYNHNDIFDGYHSGIVICDAGCPPGGSNSKGTFNITVSFNHVYNLMQGLTNDTGAVYFNTGTTNFIGAGNQVLNNKIHDINDASVLDSKGYGGFGIKLDSDTGLVDIENNLVYRTTDQPMSQTCGPQLPNSENTIKNNVFSFTKLQLEGISCAPPSGVSQFNFTNNLLFFSTSSIQFGCAYCPGGNCLPAVQKYSSNMYCDISSPDCTLDPTPFRTTTSACSQVKQNLSWSNWQGMNEDLTSKVMNPLFVNPFYPSDNYALQSGSPAGQVGFVSFDVNAPGRTSDTIDAPAIPASFPTGTYVATTTLVLSSNHKPSTYGQPVTFTLTATSHWGPPPDGTEVTFNDGSTVLGTTTLSQGTTNLTADTLSVGTHSISATVNATAFWPTTTSYTLSQKVNASSSSSTVTSGQNPSVYKQSVTFTGTVTSSGGTPTGSVEFKAAGVSLGTSSLSNGVAKITTSALKAGNSTVTAKYLGNDDFNPSTSPGLTQTVNTAGTTTTLTSSLNPSKSGQKVTFTANVTSQAGTPSGEVTFTSDGTTLGTRGLTDGTATYSTSSLQTGTHSITATYNGSHEFSTSTSKKVSQVVKSK